MGFRADPGGAVGAAAGDHEAAGHDRVADRLRLGVVLAGEQRLVDLEVVGLDDDAVADDLVAGGDDDDVVEDDVVLGEGPGAVGAADRGAPGAPGRVRRGEGPGARVRRAGLGPNIAAGLPP